MAPDQIIIGLAGTDGPQDVVNDLDLLPQTIGDWSDATGIPVNAEVRQTVSTAGFLAHAGLAYHGVEHTLYTQFGITISSAERPVWIAAHSLGGAAAQLMQFTVPYFTSRCFSFGAPRIIRSGCYLPNRLRCAVRRATDPVIYAPRWHVHPPAEVLYVRYVGSVRRHMPWRYRVAALAYASIAWLFGRRAISHGHAMSRYEQDLSPLR